MSEFTLKPLTKYFGAKVCGLDLAAELDRPLLRELAWAYIEHKVLVFREQSLEPEALARFATHWGQPRIDGFKERNVPGFDQISQVGNVGNLLAQDAYRNGAVFWHTDCAAEADPDASTMLYCVQAPTVGGETLFADMQSAYERLDAQTRAVVDDLEVRHCYSGTRDIVGGRERWEHKLETVTEETAKMLPSPVTRPLVRSHSVTKRKGLYSPAGSIFEVLNLDEKQAESLLKRVKRHAIDEAFCYKHKYAKGDLVVWDNTSTLHCACPVGQVGEAGPRLLYRVAPLGLPPALAY